MTERELNRTCPAPSRAATSPGSPPPAPSSSTFFPCSCPCCRLRSAGARGHAVQEIVQAQSQRDTECDLIKQLTLFHQLYCSVTR